MTEKDIHEGEIELCVRCDVLDDGEYGCGKGIDQKLLDKHGLKPGDHIQYKITKDGVIPVAKVIIKRTIKKLD